MQESGEGEVRDLNGRRVRIAFPLPENLDAKGVVGVAWEVGVSDPPVYSIQKIGVIRDVCVLQGARHHGLGTQMFQHSLGWFKNRKVGAIWVRIPVGNIIAGKFWETQGFSPFTTVFRMEFDQEGG